MPALCIFQFCQDCNNHSGLAERSPVSHCATRTERSTHTCCVFRYQLLLPPTGAFDTRKQRTKRERFGRRMTSDSEAPDPVCYTRADYRAGRKETAVRVYTVNQESRWRLNRSIIRIIISSGVFHCRSLASHFFPLFLFPTGSQSFIPIFPIPQLQRIAPSYAK